MREKPIPFFRPDITELEVRAVAETLRSGWITTGPKTKEFESAIARYCGADRVLAVSSATAGLELVLRLFGIGEGDQVVTTPYTFAATANSILHVGAEPVLVDVRDSDLNLSAENLVRAITERTKAVLPVDFGGWPADYRGIRDALDSRRKLYRPKRGTLQEKIDRPLLLSDSAHSFGARFEGKALGTQADFHVFSFHAVKNLTTAEGGAIAFGDVGGLGSAEIHRSLRLLSLHGQTKDAFEKSELGGWRYEIEIAGFKCNLTDLASALGLAQLSRYDREILPPRKRAFGLYRDSLGEDGGFVFPPDRSSTGGGGSDGSESSYHLYSLRLPLDSESDRDRVISALSAKGIGTNVHYVPLPSHPLYRRLGYREEDYPNAYRAYRSEITLPVHSGLSDPDLGRVCESLKAELKAIRGRSGK